MARETVTEGATSFQVPAGRGEVRRGPSSSGSGFYNQAMALTRDVSVLMARVDIPREPATFLDGLAAIGARGLRVAHEAPGWQVTLNDVDPEACRLAQENAKALGVDVEISQRDLLSLFPEDGWDHVEIDPYGSPVPFLAGAVRAVRPGGILSVSATDTTALHGVRGKVTRRRYMATGPPKQAPGWKAAAARLLLGYMVRQAAQFDLAATPVVAFEHQHCFRAAVRIEKGAQAANEAIGQVRPVVLCSACQAWSEAACRCGQGEPSGPYWLGPLGDGELLSAMVDEAGRIELADPGATRTLLERLAMEAQLGPFYLDIPQACSARDVDPPGRGELVEALRQAGLPAARSVFSPEAVAYQGDPEAALAVLEGLRPRQR